jgi:magnesium chelatase family protein
MKKKFMAIRLFSAMALGLQGKLIEVEVDIFQGMPAFQIVGLGDTAVQEAKERIRSAIKNSGMKYPQQKKVVNLGPASLKKTGPQFDLVMALGILAVSGVFRAELLKDYLILGELNLNGDVRGMSGVLTLALFARALGKKLLLPEENFVEASLVKGVEVLPVSSLQQLVEVLLQGEDWQKKLLIGRNVDMILEKKVRSDVESRMKIRFEDIVGQQAAKRALMVAAAGGHHVLMQGVPGVGKTLLAKAMAGILPPLSEQEMLEVWQIHSCAGVFQGGQKEQPALFLRMFREVQPSISLVALLGGGAQLKPGEISLAHHGVLFLDEIVKPVF